MNHLECHFILMKEFYRRLLQREKFVRAKVPLVIGSSISRKDGLTQFFNLVHEVCLSARNAPAEILSLAHLSSLFCPPVPWTTFVGKTRLLVRTPSANSHRRMRLLTFENSVRQSRVGALTQDNHIVDLNS